jgi:hypothetical protein
MSSSPVLCSANRWTKIFEGPNPSGGSYLFVDKWPQDIYYREESAAPPFVYQHQIHLGADKNPIFVGPTPWMKFYVWPLMDGYFQMP